MPGRGKWCKSLLVVLTVPLFFCLQVALFNAPTSAEHRFTLEHLREDISVCLVWFCAGTRILESAVVLSHGMGAIAALCVHPSFLKSPCLMGAIVALTGPLLCSHGFSSCFQGLLLHCWMFILVMLLL